MNSHEASEIANLCSMQDILQDVYQVEHRTTESNAPKVLFHLGNQIFPHPRTK